MTDASDGDKRWEFKKLQDKMDSLRKKLVALGRTDPSDDLSELKGTFLVTVEKPFTINQKWFLSQLRTSNLSQASASSSTSSGGANTKKEVVTLPSFKGYVLSSHLIYPVWRKRWDTLIQKYDEKWHINFLL